MIRVTHNSLVNQSINAALDRFRKLSEAQREVSTGKAIDRISQDPRRGGAILDLNSIVSRGEQYLRNAQSAKHELQTAEAVVGQVNDLLTRVRSLSLRVSNESLSESDRQAIAGQIDQELNELLRIANQKSGRRFVFGGDATPYVAEQDESGKTASVEASLATRREPNEIILGDGERLSAGIAAGDIFEFGDNENLFDLVISLRNSITEDDREVTTQSVGRLDDGLDNLEAAMALIGARYSAVQNTTDRLEEAKLESTQRLSELADADIVESISRYNQEEAYYQMSLQVSARIMQQSLLNFIAV